MFHLLKSRTSIDIFRTEKCKATFGLKYSNLYSNWIRFSAYVNKNDSKSGDG